MQPQFTHTGRTDLIKEIKLPAVIGRYAKCKRKPFHGPRGDVGLTFVPLRVILEKWASLNELPCYCLACFCKRLSAT